MVYFYFFEDIPQHWWFSGISRNSTHLVLISLILCHITTNLFFLRGYRHSEREKLRQQTRDNAGVNAFGFGSIAIEALTNHLLDWTRGAVRPRRRLPSRSRDASHRWYFSYLVPRTPPGQAVLRESIFQKNEKSRVPEHASSHA